MQLIKEEKRYSEVIFKGTERVSADGDIIVPDIKPDVLKVLQVDARSVITEKGVVSGGIYAEGKVFVNILYIPEGSDECTCCIKSAFDFRLKTDNPEITSDMKLKISSDVYRAEFTLLNSRKLSVKTGVIINYELAGEKELQLPLGFDGESGEYMTSTITADTISAMECCDFTVRDTLEVPSGKPSIKEIIKTDAKICGKELKTLSSKLILKGTLNLCILYLTNDCCVESCEGEFTFTEVFDADNLQEDDFCNADLSIGEIHTELCRDNDGDMKLINTEVCVNVSVHAERCMEYTFITDCYFPGMSAELSFCETNINKYINRISKQTNAKEVITLDSKIPAIVKIYSVSAESEVSKAECEKDSVIVAGKIRMYISYITDNQKCSVYTIKKDIPFEYRHQCSSATPDMTCSAAVYAENISCNLNASGELELKYIIVQEIKVTQSIGLKLICDVVASPITENNDIIICFVQSGDTLWDIAKRYSVRIKDITEANLLENENICTGQKLLIPINSAKS